MTAVEIIVPVMAGIIGYVLRHVDLFGQGSTTPAQTPATNTSASPVAPTTTSSGSVTSIFENMLRSVLADVLGSQLGSGHSATVTQPTSQAIQVK